MCSLIYKNVTTVGVENYIIQLQWTCHYNPQGTPERTEKIDEPFSFYINTNIKQLLDEVEHDIMNYQNRGLCYLPQPSASADNTDTRV